MHVIDLEIMIPASPDFIWTFLGDIASSTDWQAGVSAVSFLTTQHDGKGARWRYSYAKGSDVIIEAAAWYDTLGYEYSIVDGAGYGNNQGRIRLQEVNEGTLVRWTFNYEADGVFGGLRNAMRLKRKTTKQIQDSLRNLHNLVQKESGGVSTHSARATVREAPDVEERSIYQPRHPSNFAESSPDDDDEDRLAEDLQPIAFTLDEERIPLSGQSDGDTKPNPVVLGGDGLLDMEWQRNEIEAATEPIDTEVVSIAPEIPEATIEDPKVSKVSKEPFAAIASDHPAPTRSLGDAEKPKGTEEPLAAIPIDRPVPARSQGGAADKSELSVFEIFGLPKPSETEDSGQSPGESRKSRSSEEPAEGALAKRFRDLSLVFDHEEIAPSRDQPGYPDRSHFSGNPETVEAEPAQALQMRGLRRRARRLKRPLRSHN